MKSTVDDYKLLLDLLSVLPRKLSAVDRMVASKYLKDSRIRPYHLAFLRAIRSGDGLSQKDLTESLSVDKSYVSVTVRELIDMGLIVNDSDSKIHSIRLTDAGRDMAVMSEMFKDILSERLFSSLSRDELESLEAIASKLISSCDDMLSEERSWFSSQPKQLI